MISCSKEMPIQAFLAGIHHPKFILDRDSNSDGEA
jgi:hypothetical protein